MDHKKILEVHRDKSLERSGETDRVLVIQDATFINYATRNKTKGLGRIGKNENGTEIKALIARTALALQEDGLPIGILELKIYARQFLDNLKKQNRDKTPIEERGFLSFVRYWNHSTKGWCPRLSTRFSSLCC